MDSIQGEGMRLVRGGGGGEVSLYISNYPVRLGTVWCTVMYRAREVEIYVSFSRVSLVLAEQQMAEEGSGGKDSKCASHCSATIGFKLSRHTRAQPTEDACSNLLSFVIFHQLQTHPTMPRPPWPWLTVKYWRHTGRALSRSPFSPFLSSLTEWLHFLCAYHFVFSIRSHL